MAVVADLVKTKEVVAETIDQTTTDAIGNKLPSNLSLASHLILNEAFKRGIKISIISAEKGLFVLQLGNKLISSSESLSELTSAVGNHICRDKSLTNTVLKNGDIKVPDQITAGTHKVNKAFFDKYNSVVTKPLNLSSGQGVSVDIRTMKEVDKSINRLKDDGIESILIEEYVTGDDLRIVIINYKFVAATHRAPPQVTGNGTSTIFELISQENLRVGRINKIPVNYETKRCVLLSGYSIKDVLPEGMTISVRKNTNEYTGGIPVDVTERISPALRKTAEKIARIIGIPVAGIDLFVPDIDGDDYRVIEVNSRPGLDGHEPQPVAEKFIDFLFPESVT